MIEVSLCKRDGLGNKIPGRERLISVGKGGGGINTTLSRMADMVADKLTKGKRGKAKRDAIDEVLGAPIDYSV